MLDPLKTLSSKIKEIQKTAVKQSTKFPTGETITYPVLTDTDGDACLFNGLLSTVGVFSARDGVLWSQAGQGELRPGMFYRSPARRLTDNVGHPAFFSRDMSLGVLALYSTYKDPDVTASGAAWLGYIGNSRPCLKQKPKWMGGGCWVRSPLYYFAPDERSQITPAMWGLMKRVWDYQGWPLHGEMKKYTGMDGDIDKVEAQNNPLGYQVHLPVVASYIKLLIDQSKALAIDVAKIAAKRQPDNIFYHYVANGNKAELWMIDQLLAKIQQAPKSWGHGWLWSSSNVQTELQYSCGWDLVFMGKLLLNYYGIK
jgi:hypothetical protein